MFLIAYLRHGAHTLPMETQTSGLIRYSHTLVTLVRSGRLCCYYELKFRLCDLLYPELNIM